ncbi:MAG: DUF3883 domain-containing protein [Bacillota bacterium]|nr:DUF3883 domain-containing protein [Bacillota bacterium]
MAKLDNINLSDINEDDMSQVYSFNDLKRDIISTPIDFLMLHEIQIKIGELGEAFVYEFERNYLEGTKYFHKVDETKAANPKNGYDILSFTRQGKPLHIEVKATAGKEETFFISSHELEIAKSMKKKGLIYVVYFVKEILTDKPKLTKIYNLETNCDYLLTEANWKVERR